MTLASLSIFPPFFFYTDRRADLRFAMDAPPRNVSLCARESACILRAGGGNKIAHSFCRAFLGAKRRAKSIFIGWGEKKLVKSRARGVRARVAYTRCKRAARA